MKKDTKEIFIKKAKEIHGNKYDYSKVEYINARTKVCIICPEHGEFWQKPSDHIIRRYGCKKCGYISNTIKRTCTKEEFINKAKLKWGDIFDYSEVEYVNNATKVCIKDKNEKKYWQTPANHLYGFDCRTNKYKTSEDFITRAREIYGNFFDYSNVVYKDLSTKIKILCPKHGEFWQTPMSHLYSEYGCPNCANEHVHGLQKLTKDEFILKARQVHGWKYDYSKVEYKTCKDFVTIICPEHGEFLQAPSSHLSGHGCPRCSRNQKKTSLEFINESKQIHGDKYDYSKVEYINQKTKVNIICHEKDENGDEHGEFLQLPGNHLRGYGCPICNKNKHVSEKKLFQKLSSFFPHYKITHSYHNKVLLNKQEIDIFFNDYNIGIEYQGKQHFEPVDFNGKGKKETEKKFRYIQECDIRKNKICRENDITLFYYSDVKTYNTFLGYKVYHDYNELCKEIDTVIKKESEK